MGNRKKIEMLSDLLKSAKGGDIKKTRLYNRLDTTFAYFQALLNLSVRKEFIYVDEKGYGLTKKGAGFCEEWEEYAHLKQRAEQLASTVEDKKQEILKKYGLRKL